MSAEDHCAFGLGDPPGEEVVSVEDNRAFGLGDPIGEDGGVGGRLLCFWIWRPSWGGGWCRFLGRRVVSVEDYCVFGFGDSPGEEVGGE